MSVSMQSVIKAGALLFCYCPPETEANSLMMTVAQRKQFQKEFYFPLGTLAPGKSCHTEHMLIF